MTQILRSLSYLLNSHVLMADFHFSCTLVISIKFVIYWLYSVINLCFGSHRFCYLILIYKLRCLQFQFLYPSCFFDLFFNCCAYSFVLHFFLQWRDSLTQFSWPMGFSVSFLVETNLMAYFNPGWEHFYENTKNSHFVKNFCLITSSKWQKKLFSVFN